MNEIDCMTLAVEEGERKTTTLSSVRMHRVGIVRRLRKVRHATNDVYTRVRLRFMVG